MTSPAQTPVPLSSFGFDEFETLVVEMPCARDTPVKKPLAVVENQD